MEPLKPGRSLHGFTVLSQTALPEYNGTGYKLQHTATGLELFHIHNPDDENFFSFIFKTPPRNNSGTAHIIEHSVLAGSRNFPVKDPFLELMKGSAQTFMNAFTYPDKTVYPASSPLKQDYFHLMEVYGDAVFFPLLRKEVFQQEGIRIVPGAKGSISFDGIVFNEMRGAYSDHDSITSEHSHRLLFPDTPYGMDSGGKPTDIINLSYEEFRGYHAEYYHPSNCRIFLYGDISTEEQIRFLEGKFLHEFTSVRTDAEIPAPRKWKKPISRTFSSPGLENTEDQAEARGTATLNWLVGSAVDQKDIMTLELLTETLLGNPGAPLYQAIIESGLGMDLASLSGMDPDFREIVFTVGIKGITKAAVPEFEQCILKTLQDLVKKGIPEEYIQAAVKKIEFQHRELRGGMPRGLRAMTRSIRGWLHGCEPETTLMVAASLEEIKNIIADDPKYLQKFLQERFIKNQHRALVAVMPDPDYLSGLSDQLAKSASDIEAKLNKKKLKTIQEEKRKLDEYHNREDTREELESIPRLKVEDMPSFILKAGTEPCSAGGINGFKHSFFTNGIAYIDGAFDLAGLDREELRIMPLFSRLVYMTGTPDHNYTEISRMLAEKTGGFYTFLDAGTPLGKDSPELKMFFRCKVLEDDVQEALNLVRQVLLTSTLDDPKRIRDIIREQQSDFSSEFIPSGNAFANLRASSRLREAFAIEEHWRGINQIEFIQSLDTIGDEEVRELGAVLESIREKLLASDRMIFNITTDASKIAQLEMETAEFIAGFNKSRPPGKSHPGGTFHSGRDIPFETCITSTDVAFNAIALPAPTVSEPEQSAYTMLSHILSTQTLWERIRVKGGAYGAHAEANLLEGSFSLSSYRDPRIAGTFEDFTFALEDAASGHFSDYLVEQAIISLISRELRLLKPRELSMMGFRRALYGITDELRQERRSEFLFMTRERIIAAAASLLSAAEDGQGKLVTIAGKELVDAESKKFPRLLEELHTINLH